jgi:hypothetical protein
MKTVIQFIAAVIVGTAYECFKFVQFKASGLWLSATGKIPRVSKELANARLAVCRQCPIFYSPTQTCGSPFNRKARARGRPAGCLCFMPFKVKFECNCWLWEELQCNMLTPEQKQDWLFSGWKGSLNTDYAEG